jgi:hypothetical protein
MKIVVPALAAALVSAIGVTSPAEAALINFAVSAFDGSGVGYAGTRLDNSTSFEFDGAALLVSSTGVGDMSGLAAFVPPVFHFYNAVTLSPTDIVYGSGSGTVSVPISVDKNWTGKNGDVFDEELTTVTSINRGTPNAITVTLLGTVSDSFGDFVDTPIQLIIGANQSGGFGTAIQSGFTNTTVLGAIPEPSTWVMLALGFAGLGYAAVRRSAKDRSAAAM